MCSSDLSSGLTDAISAGGIGLPATGRFALPQAGNPSLYSSTLRYPSEMATRAAFWLFVHLGPLQ